MASNANLYLKVISHEPLEGCWGRNVWKEGYKPPHLSPPGAQVVVIQAHCMGSDFLEIPHSRCLVLAACPAL